MTPEQAAERGIKVKQLEWRDKKQRNDPIRFEVMSKCGLYKITEWFDASGNVLFFGVLSSPIRIDAPTVACGIDDLKAAAQADYERRVLEALE